MVYNFNLGIGWASSGVEYAQVYRARMFRSIGVEAKFIFTDMFPRENIEHMTANIGFLDSEIIWLYTYFTDSRIAPVSYTLTELEKRFGNQEFTFSREGKRARYIFSEQDDFCTVYLVNETDNFVHRVEWVSRGYLIRKDYFTYCRIYSEYYAPLNNEAHLYQRRFFNEDGSVAYEELIDGDALMYRFPDRMLYSKEELVAYLVSSLELTQEDTVIIDRSKKIGSAILRHAEPARVVSIIHADHFNESNRTEDTILWNNYYEYLFSQHEHVDVYVTATDAQNQLLRQQFETYVGVTPHIVTIPVGSLRELVVPSAARKPYSLITASRLASEKHIDWLVEAVVEARKYLPELTLDIYGKGGEEKTLRALIQKRGCDSYVRLCGQQKLDTVYQQYEAYVAGSMSEGFGLTLMEAVGSGLPIIGFDVRYGNPTFIDSDENGYLIPVNDKMSARQRVEKLTECIVRLFADADLEKFHAHSYEKAKTYLTEEVAGRWKAVVQ